MKKLLSSLLMLLVAFTATAFTTSDDADARGMRKILRSRPVYRNVYTPVFVTRAEMVHKLVEEVMEVNPTGNSLYYGCFDDTVGITSEPYICYAKQAGLANGYADGTFKPSKFVMRAEAAKMFATFGGLTIVNPPVYYTDVQDAGTWYFNYVSTLLYYEIPSITAGHKFYPDYVLTKGRFDYWLNNLKEVVADLPETTSVDIDFVDIGYNQLYSGEQLIGAFEIIASENEDVAAEEMFMTCVNDFGPVCDNVKVFFDGILMDQSFSAPNGTVNMEFSDEPVIPAGETVLVEVYASQWPDSNNTQVQLMLNEAIFYGMSSGEQFTASENNDMPMIGQLYTM